MNKENKVIKTRSIYFFYDLTLLIMRGNMQAMEDVMTLDDIFVRDEKRAKILYDSELLAMLLLLNYEFSRNKYHNTTASDIFKSRHDIKYTREDLKTIKENAIILLGMRYNTIVKDYEKLDFEKIR